MKYKIEVVKGSKVIHIYYFKNSVDAQKSLQHKLKYGAYDDAGKEFKECEFRVVKIK